MFLSFQRVTLESRGVLSYWWHYQEMQKKIGSCIFHVLRLRGRAWEITVHLIASEALWIHVNLSLLQLRTEIIALHCRFARVDEVKVSDYVCRWIKTSINVRHFFFVFSFLTCWQSICTFALQFSDDYHSTIIHIFLFLDKTGGS